MQIVTVGLIIGMVLDSVVKTSTPIVLFSLHFTPIPLLSRRNCLTLRTYDTQTKTKYMEID